MKGNYSFIVALAVSLLVAGCATTERTPPQRLTGNPAVDAPALLTNGPSRDKVLLQYRIAATAMQRGQFDEAKRLLDDAILEVTSPARPVTGEIVLEELDAEEVLDTLDLVEDEIPIPGPPMPPPTPAPAGKTRPPPPPPPKRR